MALLCLLELRKKKEIVLSSLSQKVSSGDATGTSPMVLMLFQEAGTSRPMRWLSFAELGGNMRTFVNGKKKF